MLDYTEIFNRKTSELVAEGLLPVKPGISDDENIAIIDKLREHAAALEEVIERARIERHAIEKGISDRKSTLSSQRKQEQEEKDMNYRQKKQLDKVDNAVRMKQLQRDDLVNKLRAINYSDAEIKAFLVKKGLE